MIETWEITESTDCLSFLQFYYVLKRFVKNTVCNLKKMRYVTFLRFMKDNEIVFVEFEVTFDCIRDCIWLYRVTQSYSNKKKLKQLIFL